MQYPDPILERFLSESDRSRAVAELANRGALALPTLEALFDGSAVNRHGVPYRKLGSPLDCGLVTAAHLGPIARPLERLLRAELRSGHVYAAPALGALGLLDEDSIVELSGVLSGDLLLSSEAAAALVKCGNREHPAVKAAAKSKMAEQLLQVSTDA